MSQCQATIKTCRKCEAESQGAKVCACGEDLRCTQDAVRGYTRCISHGGPVPSRGFYGRGTMTTGSGSSFPITRLAAKYNELRKNGNLLSNRRVVEILDDRIVQLAGRIDVDDAPQRMSRLRKLWEEYKLLVRAERHDEAMGVYLAIDAEFDKAYHDYMAWQEMYQAFDLRRKTAESEVKILKEIKGIITYEDAYQFSANLLGIAMRVIGDDPRKLKELQFEFARAVGEISDNVEPGFVEADADESEPG